MKIKHITMREDDAMKIKSVSGTDVTIDQGGQEIKTTSDALVPDATHPGSFAMKPTDPNQLKPGATVTQSTPATSETMDDDEADASPRTKIIVALARKMGWGVSDLELLKDRELAALFRKHVKEPEVAETHQDLIAQGNHDVGGDATDRFIDQVRDKGFERANRYPAGHNTSPIGGKLKESDELYKWLTIAGIK